MKYEKFLDIQEGTFKRIRQIRETKGREYADDSDTLADFKEVAEAAGVTWEQCWLVYVEKHQRAIATFVREGAVKSESIEDRVLDVIVYHLLLLGLIEDARHRESTTGFFGRAIDQIRGEAPEDDPFALVDRSHRNLERMISQVNLEPGEYKVKVIDDVVLVERA